MSDLIVCITYDDNFEPMCSHLCFNLLKAEGIEVRLNKTESEKDHRSGFQSKNWYSNLSSKIRFIREKIEDIKMDEIICCCDADIQFFKAEKLFDIKNFMRSSNFDYIGQREGDKDEFNGGFFFLKKTKNTVVLLEEIISKDLTMYKYAEQDLINELIPKLGIKYRFLSRIKYLHGCMRKNCYVSPNIADKIVMHHATCSYNALQKMQQMNEIRSLIGFEQINWNMYSGVVL